MTLMPRSRAIWAAATPTPPLAPLMSKVCPDCSCNWVTPSYAVAAATVKVAASVNETWVGLAAVASAVVSVNSANPPDPGAT